MDDLIRYRLIACSVFTRELCAAVAASPWVVDPEFLELGAHERPDFLRSRVQDAVDRAEGLGYAAVLLGYGLCGNALAGIRARSVPLVVPRAHDCCTIFLGSSAAFLAEFGDNLSAPWSSCGYLERSADYLRRSASGSGYGLEYEELVKKYGEDNAAYLWETLHPAEKEPLHRWIEMPSSSFLGHSRRAALAAESEGKEFRSIRGDDRILRALVDGPWPDADFMMVRPGEAVEALYDFDRVMRSAPLA